MRCLARGARPFSPPAALCRGRGSSAARFLAPVLLALPLLLAGACSDRRTGEHPASIRVWAHQGQEAENQALRSMAEAFNRAHADEGLRVDIDFFPDYQYTEKVSIAAAARDLPEAMEVDGPTVAPFVDAGLLQPLDPWFEDEVLADFLPTIIQQGTIGGRLYALGAFDSAMALYYDREMLQQAGVEPPGDGQAWEWPAFVEACRTLKGQGVEPVALHMDISADEWFTYAFSPVVWSAGGRLVSESGDVVEGVLDSERNVASLQAWQRLFTEDLVNRNPVDPNPFGSGKAAMDWTGHWMARSHMETKGERLGVMPLPRLGSEPSAPCGSWCWSITADAGDPAAAAAWVAWVTDAREGVLPMVRANGAVPSRKSVFAMAPEYGKPPYSLFRTALEESGRPRPRTPHYAPLTQHFAAALRDIAGGADVEARLGEAAARIQQIIDRNEGRR